MIQLALTGFARPFSCLVDPTRPRERLSKHIYLNQTARCKASQCARDEYERIVTQERLRLAAANPSSPSTSVIWKAGDFAYVYCEDVE